MDLENCKDENKIYMYREKFLVYFYSPKRGSSVRYNLKEKSMQKEGNKCWYNVCTQYKFFHGFSLYDVECEDEKFLNMLRKVKDFNSSCTSFSTFVSRLNEALVYENYIVQEVKYHVSSHWRSGRDGSVYTHFKHGLEDYDKSTIKWLKDVDYCVTNGFESFYFEDKEKVINLINILSSIDIPVEKQVSFMDRVARSNYSNFYTLVNEHNYNMKALLTYIFEYLEPFENMTDYRDAMELLKDYYSMAKTIGRNVKRYPKYLRSMHDIITSNYNAYKREYDEILFSKLMKKKFEMERGLYCMVNPTCSKDVIREGTDLNHCVGSYINKILERKTYIIFMREKLEKEKSLVTVEIQDNKIINAKGACNRAVTKEEKTFLEQYCKTQKMELSL